VSLGGLLLELAIFLVSAQNHLLLKCSVKNIQADFGDLQGMFHQVCREKNNTKHPKGW
jgi:hypothetical protein